MSEETFQSVSANEVHLSNDAIFTSVNGKSIDELVKGRLPLSLLLRPPIRHIFRAATKEVSDGESINAILEPFVPSQGSAKKVLPDSKE